MLGSSLAGEASIVYSQLDYLNALYKLRRRLPTRAPPPNERNLEDGCARH